MPYRTDQSVYPTKQTDPIPNFLAHQNGLDK